ncbi:hydroxymethylbilane synthase [Streptomyces sp. NPDC091278]|uniref:hydroxymethylbilane synthase n=1 Tax=Streptomyces sp. NPDC091278 TaxID=3155301 RepID=UPI00344CF118
MEPLRIGARASLMSLTQSAPLLAALSPTPLTLTPFPGEGGDREEHRAPLEEDGTFSKGIEAALLAGEIDVAVHCLKDVSAHDTPGLVMGAYLPRDDVRDCLVTRHPEIRLTLDDLHHGARVGTASVRRQAALRTYRPDLNVIPVRGPIDRRLHMLDTAELDALVVASCSMDRLGLRHRITQRIGSEIICPPLGAAIIALQTREDDMETRKRISKLHDRGTEAEAEAERLVLRQMDGFCNAPIAGYCKTNRDGDITYTVRTRAFTVEGDIALDVRLTGKDATRTALAVCQQLTRHGALELAQAT